MALEFTKRKRDGVRVHHEKKLSMTKSDGGHFTMRKSDGVRVQHEKER